MRWLIADSLYCPEAFDFGHLDSYAHYLREYGEDVSRLDLSYPTPHVVLKNSPPVDVVFALDGYGLMPNYPARIHIAQIAAICNPMPWDVRKPDGSPAYDLVISSIPWMVDQARAKGCRAEYMSLCFDTRALVCGMDVTERDIPCLFVGSQGGNHVRRTQLLSELSDVVTVAPPTFGRDYFRLLARARSVFHCGAELARGEMNAMRVYEAMGMGALLVVDDDGGFAHGGHCAKYRDAADVRRILSSTELSRFAVAAMGQMRTLLHDTYIQRIPELVRLARSL